MSVVPCTATQYYDQVFSSATGIRVTDSSRSASLLKLTPLKQNKAPLRHVHVLYMNAYDTAEIACSVS